VTVTVTFTLPSPCRHRAFHPDIPGIATVSITVTFCRVTVTVSLLSPRLSPWRSGLAVSIGDCPLTFPATVVCWAAERRSPRTVTLSESLDITVTPGLRYRHLVTLSPMDQSIPDGYLTKQQVSERHGPSVRTVTREITSLLTLRDEDGLVRLRLATDDDKVRVGTEVTQELIDDLNHAGLKPQWYVDLS